MANSKYEYVKLFEAEDEVMLPNLIVILVSGCNFSRFSEAHEFVKTGDEMALNLMNYCATATLDEYPDIVFSYGFSNEYSFVFKKTSKFYQRRASKLCSLVVSFFSSSYVTKWNKFFPLKELKHAPSFHARVICCATIDVLQTYLAWRQKFCHVNNLHNTCVWKLVEMGMTEREAQEILKGTEKMKKHELLFQEFNVNYTKLSAMFRQGSCIFKIQVEEVVKNNENGDPVKRLRKKAVIIHSSNIAARRFWNTNPTLLKEVGGFMNDIDKVNADYVRAFQVENKLMSFTWIVIRIDGCHFHRFSEVHEFEKPNDVQALNLMNSCAAAVMKEFRDIVFCYGVSDEYSFILKKNSQFYQRQASGIVSSIVSFFTSTYAMRWKDFFPHKHLQYPPVFDGRAVCYPSLEILQDYLAWRQVDCKYYESEDNGHINNQYNTCFWELVKSGKSKNEAQNYLKGTQAQEKEDLLCQKFDISYNELPIMFRQGSSVFWDEDERSGERKVIVTHSNIIEPSFWKAHPEIFDCTL